jgi:uridine kinase
VSDAASVQGADLAALVARTTAQRPATLGQGRLVCVDGPTGSGKTTLAAEVARAAAGSVAVVHVDDLLAGWSGLPAVAGTLRRAVLEPLSQGLPGRYRRYDWHEGRFAEERGVEPVDLLVVEGVGAGDSSCAAWITTLVWMDAPPDLRLERSVSRDGERLREHLQAWMRDEAALFARERTSERADVVVHRAGTSGQSVQIR